MALRQVAVSDISGRELKDDQHARIVISGAPGTTGNVELDVSTDEAAKLQSIKLDLINITVYEPNQRARQVVIDAATLGGLYKNVDIEQVLRSARRASDGGAPRQRAARGTAAKGDKRDYASPEWAGVEHRGRTTEAEAAWVRENLEAANKNRAREGQDPIDPTNEKYRKRYGF